MILIPNQIGPHENRQNDLTYSRGGQFLEDMQSQVWLEVGTRWFYLANFTELVSDVEYFYKNIVIPNFGLRLYQFGSSTVPYIEPMHFMETKEKVPEFAMYFDDDIRVEHYEPFNTVRAMDWRNYASANINQQFK